MIITGDAGDGRKWWLSNHLGRSVCCITAFMARRAVGQDGRRRATPTQSTTATVHHLRAALPVGMHIVCL
jgi:hypothetical protein